MCTIPARPILDRRFIIQAYRNRWTNLPFENWTEVLGSERLTGATLARLTHRCHILETAGESYRLQEAKRRYKKRSSSQPSQTK